ncbi:MAG: hypothetical protein ABSB35_36280 [Bryobacteraceae bacterium]|jgi:hypothetical protein
MTSNTEIETVTAATAEEPKATKKAHGRARGAYVAPKKAKARKKATPAKKAPKTAPKAKAARSGKAAKEKGAREGSKTQTILEMLKRPGGVTSKELSHRLAASFRTGVPVRYRREEDGADRHLHEGRRRRALLLRRSLIASFRNIAPLGSRLAAFLVLEDTEFGRPICQRQAQSAMSGLPARSSASIDAISRRQRSIQLASFWTTLPIVKLPFDFKSPTHQRLCSGVSENDLSSKSSSVRRRGRGSAVQAAPTQPWLALRLRVPADRFPLPPHASLPDSRGRASICPVLPGCAAVD